MNPQHIQWAVDKLRVYAADDICDRDRLSPVIEAYDSEQFDLFRRLCASTLGQYAACDGFIDQLHVDSAELQKEKL